MKVLTISLKNIDPDPSKRNENDQDIELKIGAMTFDTLPEMLRVFKLFLQAQSFQIGEVAVLKPKKDDDDEDEVHSSSGDW